MMLLNRALSYPDFYGVHRDTLFLNPIISVALAYLIFHKHDLNAVAGGTNPVQGAGDIPIEHDILFGTICFVLGLFASYFMFKLLKQVWKRRSSPTTESTVNEIELESSSRKTGTQEGKYVLEVDGTIKTLSPGQSMNCIIHNIEEG